MAFLNQGQTAVRDLLKNSITTMEMGTDGTLFSPSQTGLIAPVATTIITPLIANIPNGFKLTYDLGSNVANGNILKEFIVNNSTTTITRGVIPLIDKTIADAVQINTFILIDKNNE